MRIYPRRLLLLALLTSGMCGLAAKASTSAGAPAAVEAKLSYRRVFKSSSPEFIEIVVRDDADAATYEIRQLDDDPGASPFQVGASWREKMFELAGQLKNFDGLDLDVHRRIANLGS